MSAGPGADSRHAMNTLLLLFAFPTLAAPAVADLLRDNEEAAEFVVEANDHTIEPPPKVEMDEALFKGAVPSGPRVRQYGGRIELEAGMGADGVSAADADLVFAQTSPSELTTTALGRVTRDETAVTGWVGLSDGKTHLARRGRLSMGTVCAEREGATGPERDMDLRLTRLPPASEALAQEAWDARPSFVMGEDKEGLTAVYTSLQHGDQVTVVQITGGPRYVEEVELTRTGRVLRWRRDHKGESVCYEEPVTDKSP